MVGHRDIGGRYWPCGLFLLIAWPALAGVSTPADVVEVADISLDTINAARRAEFLSPAVDARPWQMESEVVVADAGEAEAPANEQAEGSIKGAAVFLLAFVPLIYVVFVAFTDSGIVVVAREQPAVQPRATGFVNEVVLVASIEHDITFDLDAERPKSAKVSAGGLGKVSGQLQRIHPTDLISVHPVWGGKEDKPVKYGFEHDAPSAEKQGWARDAPITAKVEGIAQTVLVYRRTVAPRRGEETVAPQVTYLLLEHPWFRRRPEIYLGQPGSVSTLRFFSLWNQAVGALIAREDPWLYQCPDYHTALAPWYALRACGQSRPPPRVTLVLHNAEYQGAISSQQLRSHQLKRLAAILDLPPNLVKTHMMIEGGFNMLQAGIEYVQITQAGYGVCAVSETYAEESKVKHRVLWPLPEVVGLDNPMLENERPKPKEGMTLTQRRRSAKEALYAHKDFRPVEVGLEEQTGFGYLKNDPNARIFVFLGRWVKQKGMDYIADIAEWIVSTHPRAQLAIIGPPGDSFGKYCSMKLQILADTPAYQGRMKILPQFYNINQVDPDVKFAFDFCFMPSRDEPFGYVDIEFGWFGALTVGSITGGLGKVPGIYYIPKNVNSASHICHLFKGCVNRAMQLTDRQLTTIAEAATRYTFPVDVWQASLLELYTKSRNAGDRVGISTAYLRTRHPKVSALFRDAYVVGRDPKAPRRTETRRRLGNGSLEQAPIPFSSQQMRDQDIRVGHATASFSLRADDEMVEAMEEREFIRKEVDDEAIEEAVEELVRMETTGAGQSGWWCREPPCAQDVLAVTQWNAMTDGEFDEPMRVSPAEPFCGLFKCLTKFLTKWLAGKSCTGLKRIDLFIVLHYITAPLLQALCIAQLPRQDLNRWPKVLGSFVLPFAIVFWTKLSMFLDPNRVMACAVILRVPVLFASTLLAHFSWSPSSIGARLLLFVVLNFLAGADQIFVFYNFMGAAVGDTSKLALRMGMCSGILGATAFFGQVAVTKAVSVLPILPGGIAPLSCLGLLVDVFFAIAYTCAPAPYREFCLPDWDLKAMMIHRKTLKYIAANIVLGAVTDPGISGSAVMIWRTATTPFADHSFLGAKAGGIYAWLMPLLLAVMVIVWSYILYRAPDHSLSLVKAGAFLLVPPGLLRGVMVLCIKNNDSSVTAVDCLFILSLFLDVIRSTCIYVALLSVVGSRWRFVSFMTVALFFRQLLGCFVNLVVTVLFGYDELESYTFALRWMPVLVFFSLLQALFSIGGFFCFDRESSALLTNAKTNIASVNNKGLRAYLAGLEGAH
mmetsp:Transcript_34332/g.92978  ORF Transcript_34332/g.92978 Transcript_34332/m.92978 type:complete len:1286 (-) Transcript_34332:171-4028(-)